MDDGELEIKHGKTGEGSKNAGESKAQSATEFSETISFLEQLRQNGPWVLTAILPDKSGKDEPPLSPKQFILPKIFYMSTMVSAISIIQQIQPKQR